MEHIRIATYEIEAGTFESVADLAHRGLLRTYQDQPGFLRQSLVRLEDIRFLSITVWRTWDQADHAVGVAEDWVCGTDTGAVNFRPKPIRQRDPLDDAPAAI